MYEWRKMSAMQREAALHERQLRCMPFHGPPHYGSDVPRLYHLTAACFEHQVILGKTASRMAAFERDLVAALGSSALVVPPSGGIGGKGACMGIPAEAGTTSGDSG